jgi:SH3-like domain-containing protein
MSPIKRLGVLAVCVIFSWTQAASAAEFKNIGAGPVIMYDAPSVRGQKLFIAPNGMPVEVVMNYAAWSKIRDSVGDLSWVETKQLVERKNIVVRNISAKIYASPDETSDVVFSADKGVLLELIETTPGWVKVKHADGVMGFVKSSDVWGVNNP